MSANPDPEFMRALMQKITEDYVKHRRKGWFCFQSRDNERDYIRVSSIQQHKHDEATGALSKLVKWLIENYPEAQQMRDDFPELFSDSAALKGIAGITQEEIVKCIHCKEYMPVSEVEYCGKCDKHGFCKDCKEYWHTHTKDRTQVMKQQEQTPCPE